MISDFTRRGVLSLGAASFAVAGCDSLIGPTQPPLQIYVLKPSTQPMEDLASVSWQLSIARPEAMQSLQTNRIALERGNTFDYFADAQWTDTTPRLVQSLLLQAFEASGRIGGVAPDSAGMHADYELETEIHAFEAQYAAANAPPDVVVTIAARLLTAGRGEVVGTHAAEHRTRASQNAIGDVVAAFREATGECLEDLVRWTLKTAPRKPAGA